MQLDLGAQSTMIYERSIAPYLQLTTELNKKIDTTQPPVFINSQPNPSFHHINLTLDRIEFPDLSVALYKNFGDPIILDSAKTPSSKHIGTIGTDIFQNGILVIDYPNQRICLIDSLPEPINRKASFINVKIEDGRLTIPFTIDSQQKDIIFDTGYSIFSILTSAENSANFAEPNQPIIDSLIGEQWGHKLVVYGKKITKTVSIGHHKMESGYVYYLPDKSQKALEDELKIIGLTGNAYFLKNIIIIDYNKKRFGIL